jgi:hypothetical protein
LKQLRFQGFSCAYWSVQLCVKPGFLSLHRLLGAGRTGEASSQVHHMDTARRIDIIKRKKAAERAAETWEETAKAVHQQEKCAAGQEQTPTIPAEKRHDDFSSFVNNTWLPLQVKNGSNKPCTVLFYQNNANLIVQHFKGKTLQSITPMDIEKYLVYLRTEYKSKLGKPLSPKTTHHMYAMLL